jgi:hypothetical protein
VIDVRLFRRGGVPAEALAALGVQRSDHVIASARTRDGRWVVATAEDLIVGPLPAAASNGDVRRWPWERIGAAAWRDDALEVSASVQYQSPQRLVLRFDEPGRLPEAVRDRVTASIVVNEHVRIDGRRGVRIVGRRRAGQDELVWTLAFDRGLDADDPWIRGRAEEELARLRETTGM